MPEAPNWDRQQPKVVEMKTVHDQRASPASPWIFGPFLRRPRPHWHRQGDPGLLALEVGGLLAMRDVCCHPGFGGGVASSMVWGVFGWTATTKTDYIHLTTPY